MVFFKEFFFKDFFNILSLEVIYSSYLLFVFLFLTYIRGGYVFF